MSLSVGQTYRYERQFEKETVVNFAELTGDDQDRHTVPDEKGRLMVQGLLTASMVTELGGELEILAHTMNFQFLEPVYTGE